MVDLLPEPPPPPGGHWPRNWHEYQNYQVVHSAYMTVLYEEGVVIRDTLQFIETRDGGLLLQVNLLGRVHTASGALLHVNKWLDVEDRGGVTCVMTGLYDYHAYLPDRNGSQRNLFRYDNSHGGVETLHRHRFDIEGTDRGQVDVVPERMPPLSHVIEETEWLGRHLVERDRELREYLAKFEDHDDEV